MSRLIWIYAVCKSLLLSPVAVKEISLSALQTITNTFVNRVDHGKMTRNQPSHPDVD